MKAVVVGAGIGGLASAIALRKAGAEVVVAERARTLEAIGAGIIMSANAMRVLDALGVAEAVRARGFSAERARVRNLRGKVLFEVRYAEHGWETYGIHRADLQHALLDALPEGAVQLGRTCVGVTRDAHGATARFDDGGEERGDVLVGADGIHSIVRAQTFGDERPRYGGHAAWRAVTQFEHGALEGAFTETWGPRGVVGTIPIGAGRVYWYVGEISAEDAALPERPKDEFRRRFRDWHEPIPAVIDATEESALSRTLVYDRPPLRRWSDGRVTLVGDAAHPMEPNLGQGAAQALEDAFVLGRSFAAENEPERALERYERRRRKRAGGVVKQSRQAARMAEVRHPLVCGIRDALMTAIPDRLLVARQRQLFEPALD